MKLAGIPQILELLEQKQIIIAEQKSEIVTVLDNAKAEGKSVFAGEIGIRLGFYDKASLDRCLIEQTVLKAEAAVDDIQTIEKDGKQNAPEWLKANWGNNGVNASSKESTIADGVSAAANIAQNIVMIANEHPEMAKDLVGAISASANLARGIADGSSAQVPLSTKSQEWIDFAREGLRIAVRETGYKPNDRNGAEINLEDFISERFVEVEKAIELSGQSKAVEKTSALGLI